jgi:replicative DNA helicase
MATAPVMEEIGNAEAEAALCGALMCENSLIDGIADRLNADDFSDAFFGRVYSVIVKERALGHSPNPVTLRPYFKGDDTNVLAALMGSGITVLAARDCAEQIRELAQRRRLIEALTEATNEATNHETSVHEIAAIAEAALSELAEQETGSTELSAADCARQVIEAFEEERETGITSGLSALDAALGPLRAKSLNIVAGRPGMGKSATALSYGLGAAQRGHGVLFISLEMASDEIGERMLSDICFDSERTRIPFNAISSGNLTSEQKRILCRAHEQLGELPFAVVDIGAATVGKVDRLIRRYARRFQAKGSQLGLVIVDYLGLVRPDRDRPKTYEEVSDVSRGLKAAAKKNGVALMALHQLSRKVEERKDKRPNMADLRDSGQIEQDADSILFLFAPEYYLQQEEPSDEAEHAEWEALMADARGKLDFIVAKRRRGPAAVGRGWFYRAYQAVRG